MLTPASVSYTHLDVYKRQVFSKRTDGFAAKFILEEGNCVKASLLVDKDICVKGY